MFCDEKKKNSLMRGRRTRCRKSRGETSCVGHLFLLGAQFLFFFFNPIQVCPDDNSARTRDNKLLLLLKIKNNNMVIPFLELGSPGPVPEGLLLGGPLIVRPHEEVAGKSGLREPLPSELMASAKLPSG